MIISNTTNAQILKDGIKKMINMELNNKTAEDWEIILELKKMGVSDETIQIAYDNTIKKRKEKDVKTRQSELLEMYPNANLYYDGVIDLKPCRMDTTMLHRGGKCEQYNDCDKCRRDFWMAQLKHD